MFVRVQIGVDGARHFLTIKSASLDDEATYKVQVEGAVSVGKLFVEGLLFYRKFYIAAAVARQIMQYRKSPAVAMCVLFCVTL